MADGQFTCAICNTRKPRRFCPGVAGDICSICCGTERENSVNCPLECQYLREARSREKDRDIDPREFPNQDIRVDETFLRNNEPLLLILGGGLAQTALGTTNAIDADVREALESMVRTYLTLQSGLVYEVRPDNPIAARIQSGLQERIREVEQVLKENNAALRDSDVLKVLAFLQRLEIQKNNGRRKGRAFIDFLREFFPSEAPGQPESSLILP